MIPTGHQIREARALAGLSQEDLATAADVEVALITRIEAVDGMVLAKKTDRDSICCALKDAGMEFTAEPPGVRLRVPIAAQEE